MSIRELLDDGAVTPATWKKLAVSNLRTVNSTISNDLVVTRDLDVGRDLEVTNDLLVSGDADFEQVIARIGVRLKVNDAEHNLSFYRSLTNTAVNLGGSINGGVATNKVYYEKVGRLVTLSFVSSANNGIFTVGGAHAALPFAALGADIAAQLTIDLTHVAGFPAADDFVFTLNGAVVLVALEIDRVNSTFTFRKIAPNGALALNDNFDNFTISFVAATAG